MEIKSLAGLLRSSARKYPRRTAIVFGSKKVSYKALDELTDHIAAGLIDLGTKEQDRVAIFLDNCPEFVISYYAILKAGAVAVPINYMFKMEEARYILEDSEAACIITSRPYLGLAEELRLRVDSLRHIICTAKAEDHVIDIHKIRKHDPASLQRVRVNPHELAVILYTSGTTGHPKGAMLTHHNLISNAIDSSGNIKVTRRDSFICVLPLFHSFAATVCMNMPLYVGAKVVIMKSLRPFKRVIRAIRKNRVTVFPGIPSIFAILKDMKLPKVFHTPVIKFFNPVRICISGAAALPAETLLGFERKFRVP
jgi:long-chain acyl-CoA synthetase